MIQTITSTQNNQIRALRDLRHSKARKAEGLFLVEGVKMCEEALRDAYVHTLLVSKDKVDTYQHLISQAKNVIIAPGHVLASVSEVKTPQGILASVEMPPMLDIDAAKGALLVLDGIQDPGNVGTMLRTAEAAGFSAAMLSPDCADAFSFKTVRASMGSIFRLPLWRGALQEALQTIQHRHFTLISAELGGKSYSSVLKEVHLPFALVIGSEGNGVSVAVSALADTKISLPMRGHAESLNAAVAAGIIMYGLMEKQYAD